MCSCHLIFLNKIDLVSNRNVDPDLKQRCLKVKTLRLMVIFTHRKQNPQYGVHLHWTELRTQNHLFDSFTNTIQSDNYIRISIDAKGMGTCIKIRNFARYHASQ